MGEKLKENWYVIVFSCFVASVMSVGITSAWARWNRGDEAILQEDYDKDRVIIFEKIDKSKDSANEYTITAIKAHEEKESIRDKAIEKMFEIIIKNQDKILNKHDSRITRLENKN